jgi:hypothetical protein
MNDFMATGCSANDCDSRFWKFPILSQLSYDRVIRLTVIGRRRDANNKLAVSENDLIALGARNDLNLDSQHDCRRPTFLAPFVPKKTTWPVSFRLGASFSLDWDESVLFGYS